MFSSTVVQPIQNRVKVVRRQYSRVHQNEADEHHEIESSEAELSRFSVKSKFAGNKPGKRVQAEKVENILRSKSQAKADRAQIVPSSCTLVPICLIGTTVEITGQQGEEGQWRFLLHKSVQSNCQRCNCPEIARRQRPQNSHHSTA